MKRNYIQRRSDWEKKVEARGLLFHTAYETVVDQEPQGYRESAKVHQEPVKVSYWDESAYYSFTTKEVDILEAATNQLHEMCLVAVQNVISNNRYRELHIPESAISLIQKSWDEEDPSIYGRFDFSYDGKGIPKLLEYNADTPTSLLEAAVIQWDWQQECFPKADQFNSIHERLIDKWKQLRYYLKSDTLHFAYLDNLEDYMNISYMRETAHQAGLKTQEIEIPGIGWDGSSFVDLQNNVIQNMFKLYPWEWLLKDEFGANVAKQNNMFWIEPAWKMVLSNKGILPILWELNPDHPNLLEAYSSPNAKLTEYVKKPFYSREGANITINSATSSEETGGKYGEEGFVYQRFAPLPDMAGNYPVIGSWVIDGESAGIGIRESNSLITNNVSRFIPHIMSNE